MEWGAVAQRTGRRGRWGGVARSRGRDRGAPSQLTLVMSLSLLSCSLVLRCFIALSSSRCLVSWEIREQQQEEV